MLFRLVDSTEWCGCSVKHLGGIFRGCEKPQERHRRWAVWRALFCHAREVAAAWQQGCGVSDLIQILPNKWIHSAFLTRLQNRGQYQCYSSHKLHTSV